LPFQGGLVCVILGCFVNLLNDPHYEALLWFVIIISDIGEAISLLINEVTFCVISKVHEVCLPQESYGIKILIFSSVHFIRE